MLTETDDLARALDDAAAAWPEVRGGAREIIRTAAGAATGSYPRDALAALRTEWPE